MSLRLTDEQIAIIKHPFGQHARVLAVAGSGKTSTMVWRIRYLVERHNVAPDEIQVLMYNRLARQEFQNQLAGRQVPHHHSIPVDTYHSYAFTIYKQLAQQGLIPERDFWVDDKEEMLVRRVKWAVENVERRYHSHKCSCLDVAEAKEAISLWKASMIPPERAGHKRNQLYAEVYREFERLRIEANGASFDDMILDVVQFLEQNREFRDRFIRPVRFLIVDEYQDVNYVQQRLIELISNRRADIMVVGDDDQTIYEWRGARIEYIRKFSEIFNDRPCRDYTLTRSFRFGPIIAQCAHNVISNNKKRFPKKVVANAIGGIGNIFLIQSQEGESFSATNQFIDEMIAKIVETDNPRSLIVIGRTWAQLSIIEGAFIARKIPYRLIGYTPLNERTEAKRMIDYLYLAMHMKSPVERPLIQTTQELLNFPNRYISRSFIAESASIMRQHHTVGEAIRHLVSNSSLLPKVQQRLQEMCEVLEYINQRINSEEPITARAALELITDRFGLIDYFSNYYGRGEPSETRIALVYTIIALAEQFGGGVPEFVRYFRQIDTKQGRPDSECITVTTVFQTKGLEFDYVFIPSCNDGYMPVRYDNENPCFDTAGIVKEPEMSAWNESERRLFYVAITRARKGVYIMTSSGVGKNVSYSSVGTIQPLLPSPYIAEMLLQPTVDIMNSLQKMAAEQTADPAELTKHYDKYGNHEPITQMLVEYYLPELGLPGIAEVVRKKAEEVKHRKVEETPAAPPKKEKKWWEELLGL